MGLCCICGQPIASPQPARTDGLIAAAGDDGGPGTMRMAAALDSDGRLLTEETATRMALLRFNALGDYQFAHVVDAYTFLQNDRRRQPPPLPAADNEGEGEEEEKALASKNSKKKGTTAAAASSSHFRSDFLRYWDPYLQGFGLEEFKKAVVDDLASPAYMTALLTQRRAAERTVVPACRRCNKAMDRPQSHTMAILRVRFASSPISQHLLELNTQKALAARKVLQQVALYFQPDPKDGRWEAKPEVRPGPPNHTMVYLGIAVVLSKPCYGLPGLGVLSSCLGLNHGMVCRPRRSRGF